MATHSLSTLVGDDEGDARVEAKSVRAELQGLALLRSGNIGHVQGSVHKIRDL